MSIKTLKVLFFAAAATGALLLLLPHHNGKPIGLYALGTVGFAGFGLFCLWAVVVKHKDVYPHYVAWMLLTALGTPFLCTCYALEAIAAWRGGPRPNEAFPFFLMGMSIWLISLIGIIRALRLKA